MTRYQALAIMTGIAVWTLAEAMTPEQEALRQLTEQLDPIWNLSRNFDVDDPAGVFARVLQSGRIREFLDQAQPQEPIYGRLAGALAVREAQRPLHVPARATSSTNA